MCSVWVIVDFKTVLFMQGQECQEHCVHWMCPSRNNREKNI